MEVSPIGAAAPAASPAPARNLSAMKSEDFFKMLVAELQNQDPFKPAKTADMISQVSQIRSIELSGKLTDTLDQLTHQQRIGGTTELIGKYVQAITADADGNPSLHEGVVTGVRFTSDGVAILELDSGEAVPTNAVVRVTTLDDMGEPVDQSAPSGAATSDKADATERQRDSGKPGFRLEGLLRL